MVSWKKKLMRSDKEREDKENNLPSGNAPTHKGALEMENFRYSKYELLEHPSYGQEFVRSKFHLISNVKNFLTGKYFLPNEEIIAAVIGYFADIPE